MIRRLGIEQASVRTVAVEAGWSSGALRHYFATQSELLAFAMRLVVERIEGRIAAIEQATDAREAVEQVLHELRPLDDERGAENEVWLAFTARALIDPASRQEHHDVDAALHHACAASLEKFATGLRRLRSRSSACTRSSTGSPSIPLCGPTG